MKLEHQVCSLDLAKKLKELGVKQSSIFYWIKEHEPYVWYNSSNYPMNTLKFFYSAFTVAELGELIRKAKVILLSTTTDKITCLSAHSDCSIWVQIKDINEANARAKMLISLIKKKIITLDNKETI